MSEVEHLVSVFPIRLESPVITSGKRYQIVFVRGKTKAKAPRSIASTEQCFVQLSSLGCFSKAIVHFKEYKKPVNGKHYHPKMINFEFLDCSTDPQGSRIGETEIDISNLLSSDGTCNMEVRHPFRMCGFGATLVVGIVVQKVVNGKPIGGDAMNFSSAGDASAVEATLSESSVTPAATAAVGMAATAATTARSAAAASNNNSALPQQVPSTYRLPRETAIAVLSLVEEYTKEVTQTSKQLESAAGLGKGAGGGSLSNCLALSHDVVALNLVHIPERTLLRRDAIERESNRQAIVLDEKDPVATEQHLRNLLASSRERLMALRKAEELVEQEDIQIISALSSGVPTSIEVERDPPLPLLLFCRQFAESRNSVEVPSTPHIHHPPIRVPPPPPPPQQPMQQLQEQLQAQGTRAVTAGTETAATAQQEAIAMANAAKAKAAQMLPGMQSMAGMFTGGGSDSGNALQTMQARAEKTLETMKAKLPGDPSDLVPNLFGSPSNKGEEPKQSDGPSFGGSNMFESKTNRSSSSPQQHFGEDVDGGGLTRNMFASEVKRASDTAKTAFGNVAARVEGLEAGMFGAKKHNNDPTPSFGEFGNAHSDHDHTGGGGYNFGRDDAPTTSFGGAGMFGGGGGGGGGGGISMFVDPTPSDGGGRGSGGGGHTSAYNFGAATSNVSFGGGSEQSAPTNLFGGGVGGGGGGSSFSAPPSHIGVGMHANAFAPTPEKNRDSAAGMGGYGGSNPFGGGGDSPREGGGGW